MKRVAIRASLRYFCARKSTTALLSSQFYCARNRFASDAILAKNGLTGTFMSPSLSTPFQRSLSTHSGKITVYEIVEAFKATNGTAEALEVIKDLESCGENDLVVGEACLKICQYMLDGGINSEKAFTFCTKAFNIFRLQNMPSWHLARALLYMGILHSEMKRFPEALGCLDLANHVLDAIGNEDGAGGIYIKQIRHFVEFELAQIKTDIGRREEALQNMIRSFELKDSVIKPNSLQDGDVHRELAKTHLAAFNFNEALPLGLKALEIYEKQLGSHSVKLVFKMVLVSDIYSGLGEFHKSLDQIELAKKVLKILRRDLDLLRAEIDVAKIQIALKNFKEAINILESVVQQTDDSQTQASSFIEMANAFRGQEKFAASKNCLEISCSVFETIEISSPIAAIEGYSDIALQYESLGEIDSAVSVNKKLLSLFEKLPKELHSADSAEGAEGVISARLGTLLLFSGKISQAVPYMESGAKKMKERLGEKDCQLGYIYKHLGEAHLKLECPESAAQMSSLAKDILDDALGPHHAESIESCQNLANAYSAMGRYGLAMEFQQQVIEAWENHEPPAEDKLREARRLLEEMKGKMQDGATTDSTPSLSYR